MAKRGRRPGQNIRELALKRRVNAIISFVAAGLVISGPLLLLKAFGDFLKELTDQNSSQVESSLEMPPIVYVILIVVALGLVANGIVLWKQAAHADQGARGEEVTSKELSQLEQEGWQVEYGMRLDNGLGDADIVCISPQSKAYVIDVKSHKGEVITSGGKLHRRMGKTSYPFEKDFIAQTMKQALQVRQQKGLEFVTPILAFSDAKVSVSANKLRKVYVVEKSKLISLLKSLG
ncbi:MAG: NERD domain-containing protein [Leptolyngbya sp. DLM2.Bin15]|nr:MAG: NERD domain-containing protein [Leptolyngbya sp. DLM2.Bin15]